jgi:hypothetical protein
MCSAAVSLARGGICGGSIHAMGVNLAGGVPGVVLADGDDSHRPEMESFVAREFLQQYSATVKKFMPWLLGLSCDNELIGVAGLRPAAQGQLFIEQYLDRRIEEEVALYTGLPVERDSIIEIGNLAGHYPGVTRALFPLLTELLFKRGYQWGVCNTTPTVQNALMRLGIPIVPMVRALPERLGVERFAWGSYYTKETTVIAISPVAAHDALMSKPDLMAMCSIALSDQSDLLPFAV